MKLRIAIVVAGLLLLSCIAWASIALEGSGISGVKIGDSVTTGYLIDHSGNQLVTHSGDSLTYRNVD